MGYPLFNRLRITAKDRLFGHNGYASVLPQFLIQVFNVLAYNALAYDGLLLRSTGADQITDDYKARCDADTGLKGAWVLGHRPSRRRCISGQRSGKRIAHYDLAKVFRVHARR
jgi:hypothetical protein